MSSSDYAKKTLDQCRKGIDKAKAAIKRNQELADKYNKDVKAWEKQKNEFTAAWNSRKEAHENKIKSWQDRYDVIKSDLAGEKISAGCNSAGFEGHCPGGWRQVEHVWCRGALRERICMRNNDTVEREAGDRTRNERGSKPGPFNEPPFSKIKPPEPTQNRSQINLACCSNVTNIVGSELAKTTINQLNTCLKNESKKAAQEKADLEKQKISQQKADEESRIAEQEAAMEREKANDAEDIASQKLADAELAEKRAEEKREQAEALARQIEERAAAAEGAAKKQTTTMIYIIVIIILILISLSLSSGLGGVLLLNV